MNRRENLKRPAAHPSVCSRPSPPKRLRSTVDGHLEARSTSLSPLSGLSTTSRHFPMPDPQMSKPRKAAVERPSAEQWFNESNHNVSNTADSTFLDGKSNCIR